MDNKIHESKGVISIGKFSTNNGQFFGSDLVHNSGIYIKISRGSESERHGSKGYFGKECLITVELTHSQFYEAITSGMSSREIPCTIRELCGKSIERIDFVENRKKKSLKFMSEVTGDIFERIKKLQEKIHRGITAKEAEEISHELRIIESHLKSNIPFVFDIFEEEMDNKIVEAKQSINGFIESKIMSMGIESLRGELQGGIKDKPKLRKLKNR